MSEHEPLVDIHCHLLPEIDDGAKSLDESLAMAKMAADQGVGTIIVTPHQLGSFSHNHGDLIRQRTAELQRQLEQHRLALQVLPGADVRIEPDMLDKIESGEVLTLGDHRRHVLLELPHELYFPLQEVLEQLRSRGITGILSHPERNQGLLRQRHIVEQLVGEGCLMQITAGSLFNAFGPQCEELAVWMLRKDLVHFIATDAHGHQSRRPLLRRAFDVAAQLAGPEVAWRLCQQNPAAVAKGLPVQTAAVGSSPRSTTGWFRRKAAV